MKERLVMRLVALVYLAVIVLWFLSRPPGSLAGLFLLRETGILLGALGLLSITWQFVLVSRLRILEVRFGLDKMFQRHRLFGRAGLVLLILHALAVNGYRFFAFGEVFFTPAVLFGVAALGGLIITGALASQHELLGVAYETWRNIHLLNYLLFPLALYHVLTLSWPDRALYYLYPLLGAVFAAVVFYRLYRVYLLRTRPYHVKAVQREAGDIWTLSFSGPPLPHLPGQFMFIQLRRGNKLSSPHPFTISSPPESENISITPKELGDFTSTMGKTSPGDLAYIDAPYGVFTYLKSKRPALIFIAGGVGITPFMSMLRHMRRTDPGRAVTLFWANRSEEQLCFREELAEMEREMPSFRPVLVMSDQADWRGERGRLDEAMMLKYLQNFSDKAFFVCGPPPMSRALIALLARAGVSPSDIYSELFAL